MSKVKKWRQERGALTRVALTGKDLVQVAYGPQALRALADVLARYPELDLQGALQRQHSNWSEATCEEAADRITPTKQAALYRAVHEQLSRMQVRTPQELAEDARALLGSYLDDPGMDNKIRLAAAVALIKQPEVLLPVTMQSTSVRDVRALTSAIRADVLGVKDSKS